MFILIEIGEFIDLIHEPNNEHDKNSAAVVKDNVLFCHVPRALSSIKQGTGSIGHFLTKKEAKHKFKFFGKVT